ncbi:MAG: ABC transporter permease, partial [Pseudomonadota bacterium]
MGIILKYMLKNLWEKKTRTFLILLAISLSTGVFFASLAISDSMMQTFMKTIKGYFGNCDLVIRSSGESRSPYFYIDGTEKYMDRLDYAIGEMSASAYFKPSKDEEVNLYLKGIGLDELNRMNPFSLKEQSGLYPFEGRKLVIASTTAEKYGIKLDDTVTLEIGKGKFKFRVCGIAAPTGHFKGEGDQAGGVVPWGTMSSLMNSKGKVDTIYLKLKNPEQKQEVIDLLSKEYKGYTVEEPFPYEMIKAETRDISMVFMMLSSVVFFMSLFIVYSSFKVITAERLPVIGTFRSIGATGRNANFMLIGESMMYGCIGGLLGCGLGIGILNLMTLIMEKMVNTGGGVDFEAVMAFTPFQLVLSLTVAIVLC